MRAGTLLAMSVLSWACADPAAFDARMAVIAQRLDGDAAAAHGCAEELRSLIDRSPTATGTALELRDDAAGYAPGVYALSSLLRAPEAVAARAREKVARREAAVTGSARAFASARAMGPAALDRALQAAAIARDARDRLCQARDVAGLVAAVATPRRRVGETPRGER